METLTHICLNENRMKIEYLYQSSIKPNETKWRCKMCEMK